MASLSDIRAALAANLAVLRTSETVAHVSAYMLDAPQTPVVQIAGVAPDGMDLDVAFGDEVKWTLVVEAIIGAISDIGAQKVLNALLEPTGATSLVEAIEANQTLTQRLSETTGRVTTGQTALAQWVHVRRYRGQARYTPPNGAGRELLVASWEVEVLSA